MKIPDEISSVYPDFISFLKDISWVFIFIFITFILVYYDKFNSLIKQWLVNRWFKNETMDEGSIISNVSYDETDNE